MKLPSEYRRLLAEEHCAKLEEMRELRCTSSGKNGRERKLDLGCKRAAATSANGHRKLLKQSPVRSERKEPVRSRPSERRAMQQSPAQMYRRSESEKKKAAAAGSHEP